MKIIQGGFNLKKRYSLILVFALILSVSLLGCSGDSTHKNVGTQKINLQL